ncbi:MAG: CrcB family protein [Pseudomonadota bacterium]
MAYLAYVALGGALGSTCRALVGLAVGFPFGTLTVNVAGSFAIGLAFASGLGERAFGPLIMVGFLGGFTTFSTFSLDVLKLVESGSAGSAFGYVAASLALSFGAVWLGVLLGARLGA